jgi:tetratricopeptide (TPR) repeat protein
MIGSNELDNVFSLIGWWLNTIETNNAVGFFNINKIAEGLALKLLNEIYGYCLENLNYEQINYPGIDLGDKVNKIAFQITSRKDSQKIEKDLTIFAKEHKNIYYNGIRFLILSQEKKPQLSKEKYQEIYPPFDPDKHILTAKDLIKEIRRLFDSDRDRFYNIKKILEEEIAGKAMKREREGEAGKKRPPFILPIREIPAFTGREQELKQLKSLLIEARGEKISAIAGLSGAGGIGKSALACYFAQLYKDEFPDGVIGLRVDNKDVDSIARELAIYVGEPLDKEDERPAEAIIQDLFSHRRMLLIFDNAEKSKDIRLLRPGGNNCAIIITTRDRGLPVRIDIPDKSIMDLPILPEKDALLLLEKFLGKERIEAEPEAAKEITALVGYLPLALEIVGKQLKVHKARKLFEMSASLHEERERLKKLKLRKDDELNVESSLSLSLKYLNEDTINFFACLSVCAPDGFSVNSAMAAGNCSYEPAVDMLDELYELSLLNQSHSNRYVLHPLIYLIAKKQLEERDLRVSASQRHARYFINLIKSHQIDHAIITEEMNDIILAARWLLEQGINDQEFVIRLQPFFQSHGFWKEASLLIDGFIDLAQRLNDWNVIIQLHIQQAKYLTLQGKFSDAEDSLKQVEPLLDKIEKESEKLRNEAMWLTTHGGVLQRQGKYDEAVQNFKKCYKLEKQLNNERGQAMVMNTLGSVYQRQCKFEKAIEAFEESYRLLVEISDERGQAMVQNSLGGALQRLGKFQEAVKAFEKSYELLVKLGDELGQAMVSTSLGKALLSHNETEKSITLLHKGFEINEKLQNHRGLGIVTPSLVRVLLKTNRKKEAIDCFNRAIAIAPGNKRLISLKPLLF